MEASDTASRYQSQRELSSEELPLEFMMNALRLKRGFPLQLFSQRTGLDIANIEAQLSVCRQRGWLTYESDNDMLCTSERGWGFVNEVLQVFLT